MSVKWEKEEQTNVFYINKNDKNWDWLSFGRKITCDETHAVRRTEPLSSVTGMPTVSTSRLSSNFISNWSLYWTLERFRCNKKTIGSEYDLKKRKIINLNGAISCSHRSMHRRPSNHPPSFLEFSSERQRHFYILKKKK